MKRALTEKQFHQLRCLERAIAVAPGFREWEPFVRRDLVEAAPAWGKSLDEVSKTGGMKFYPPLRLTADGYRAIADGIDKYGWPERLGRKAAEEEAFAA